MAPFATDLRLAIAIMGGAHTVIAVIALSFVLRTRRGFSSTSRWFLIIVGFPIAGPCAYFLLANPRIERTTRQRLEAATRLREIPRLPRAMRRTRPPMSEPVQSLFALAARLTGMPSTYGNRLELLTKNAEAFRRIEEAIAAATRFVWAEYYIIQNDETGRRFLDLLIERAAAGIEVKLLYDAVGSAKLDRARLAALRAAGGEACEFLPVNPLRRRWAVHLRNHRKVVVVDGAVGFIGGMNIGDEYSGFSSWRKSRPWRDTHLSVEGPAVRDLAEIFVEDWSFAADMPLDLPIICAEARGSSVVSAIPSGPDQEANATGLVYFTGITLAMKRCYITSPYFIPDDPTLRALESAGRRGVDVRLIVPRINDVALMGVAMRAYYPPLIEAGVRLFEYLPTMIHSKTMAIDGAFGLIGSANLDMRSFSLNFEASVLAYDPAFIAKLEERFLLDQTCCREVTKETIARSGLLVAISEGAAQLLSPLL